ncbi:MAG: NAD-dependent epimerase/dehydratase family protein [Bradymonadaceae bacterium]
MSSIPPPSQPIDPRVHRCLVIGATGTIGGAVIRALQGEGFPVRGLRRWSSDDRALAGRGIDVVVGDVLEPNTLAAALMGCSYVFYAAAPDEGSSPQEILMQSVRGIRHVLEAARDVGVEKIIVTSSVATLARVAPGKQADEDDYYLPGSSTDPFVEAKYAVEQECFRYIADGASIVILNPTLCTGPGIDLSRYVPYAGRRSTPLNHIELSRLAGAHVQALGHGRVGERYVIGGTNTTAAEVLGDWGLGGKGGLARVMGSFARGEANRPRPREASLVEGGQWFDTSKARRDLLI